MYMCRLCPDVCKSTRKTACMCWEVEMMRGGGGLEAQKPRGQGSTGPEGAGPLLWWLQLCELLPTSQKAQLT